MRAKTIAMMTAAAAPLLAYGRADGAFVGIEGNLTTVTITDTHFNQTGEAWVYRVWVAVSSPLDIVPTIFGNAANPLSINTIGQGDFFQHEFGGLAEPSAALVGAFPELAYDSFVTIGQLLHSEPSFPQTTTQGDLAFGANELSAMNGAWFRTPDAAQVQAIPAPTSTGLGVLIGQFTTAPSTSLDGTINLVVNTDTILSQVVHLVPAPGALPLLCLAAMTTRRRRRG